MRSIHFLVMTEVFSCFLLFHLILPVAGIASPELTGGDYQATGALHVDGSPVGMEIALDGRVAGQVPESGVLIIDNITVGEHAVTGSFPGYASQEMWVNVPDGLPAEIRIDLSRKLMGSLDISSSPPNVQIYVDDLYKGITPAVVEVEAGSHVVLLRLSGFQDWSTQTDVAGGETTVLSGTLVPVSKTPVSSASGGPSVLVTMLLIVAGVMVAYGQIRRR